VIIQLLARQAVGRQGLCSAAVTFFLFFFFFFFDGRLEQRDLRIYQTDLHQMFRVGKHVAVDVQFGIGFAIGQGTLP